MKKHFLLIPCCLLAVGCQSAPSGAPGTTSPQLQTVAHSEKNPSSPETVARQITVRVDVGDRRGSGTIIAKRGNRYTILTNAHVTNKSNTYRITTPDGKTHPAQCAQPLKQGTCHVEKNHDLALLEFTATDRYTAAEWGDSRNLKPGETIYSAGFPFEQTELKINRGQIKLQTSKPLQGGYQIGYDLPTVQGMSGGSLIDTNGQLIGIIGLSSEPILNGGYQYQDGSQPTADDVKALRRSSFAIPIATLAKLDPQYTAFLPKPNSGAMARAKYTGVVKRVDEIAEQITVRIEDKNGDNGSGVIVAKEGDTYYVVTAAHVVENGAVTVVTPSQERIALTDREINVVNKDVDVAVVKFKSSQNYRIAEIGKYEFNEQDWVFVSGFPGKDKSKQRHLTMGIVQDRNNALFNVKDRNEKDGSLRKGNNLVYTNLSLPGLSGGAVLDRQGRLVGINTGAENVQIITQEGESEEINFGFALGIPISTVIGVAQRQIPTAQLQVTTTPASKQNQTEESEIYKISLSALTKPIQAASAKEWLDYANLLWRSASYPESISAFETAIKLLARSPENSDRKERLKIAYYGLGLAWLGSSQIKDRERQDLQASVLAFRQAINFDPDSSQSWRYLGTSLQKLEKNEEALMAYQKAISNQKNDIVLHLQRGDILNKIKRYSDAINSYTEAMNFKSNHPWIYINRGIAYKNQKQYDQAIADFNRAIELDPQFAAGYLNRGVVYKEQKQYDLAIADFNRAIELDPQLAMAYNNRGTVYEEQKQYDRAIKDCNQAIQLDPRLAMAYINRGTVYAEQKQYDRAIADFNQAIQLDPRSAIAYSNRGAVYRKQKQYDKAMNDYNRAIQLDPQLLEAYLNRGNLHILKQQYDRGMNDYNRAIQLDSQFAVAYLNRGVAYGKQQQYDQEMNDYNRAIQLDPQLLKAYLNRGLVHGKWQQYDQAINDYNRAIHLDPQFSGAYFNRGNAYENQKKYDQAMNDYNRAIQLDPQLSEAYLNRGAILDSVKQQYAQAINDYNRAIQLDPQFAKAYFNRANIYKKYKQYNRAVEDYSRAIQLDPQFAKAYFNRANTYRENKQYDRSIKDYNRAIQINPTFAEAYSNRGITYFEQKQYSQAKADVKKAADLYRDQNNMGGYQKMMIVLKQL
jgi:tetratricopeptide (TPR) repeat protein/S1-C subfamily serine protease